MELRHVRTFLALAEELHFGRAATRLRVAQSAVSQTLKALEEEVGVTLVVRTQRSVALSPAGEAFRREAVAALAGLERAATHARAVAAGTAGRLALRFMPMSALTLLPQVVLAFRRKYPDVAVELAPGGGAELLDALRLGRCDLAFVARALATPDLPFEEVEVVELVMLASASHPLARAGAVTFAEIAAHDLVLLQPAAEAGVWRLLQRQFAAAGVEPRVVMETAEVDVLQAFVAAGNNVSVAPGFVRRLLHEGVVAVPIRPAVVVGTRAVWLPPAPSPTARNFLALLAEERDRAGATASGRPPTTR